MEQISIDGIEYYDVTDNEKLCIIYNRNIKSNKDDFIYASLINNIYRRTIGKSKGYGRKIISSEWIKNNAKKYIDSSSNDKNIDNLKLTSGNNNNFDNMIINKKIKTYHKLDVIELTESEMMKDYYGNNVEIDIRGKRESDKCFFRLKDIMIIYNIPNLDKSIVMHEEEYIFFSKDSKDSKDSNDSKDSKDSNESNESIDSNDSKDTNEITKEIYLTYLGVLTILFESHAKNINEFIQWTTKILFTNHNIIKNLSMGPELKIMGIGFKSMKDFLKISHTPLSCIFIISINTVKHLRDQMDLSYEFADDMIVCKYGYTDHLLGFIEDTTNEWYKNLDMRVLTYCYIDSQYKSNIESDLNNIFIPTVKYKNGLNDDIIILKTELLKMFDKQYTSLANIYANRNKDKDVEIRNKDMDIKNEKHKNELLEKDNQLLIKDKEMLKRENEMIVKDNQILLKNHEIDILLKNIEIEKIKMKLTI